MGEWLYYNYAAGSFHTKNVVADYIRLKKVFEPPSVGLRGNVRTPSTAC